MSAIVTNGKIRVGGVYYLISRSLGPATGCTIGIIYYFASTFSAAMYILGAVECLHISTGVSLGPIGFSMRFFSLILLGILVFVSLFGIKIVNKLSILLIFMVAISIISMMVGLFTVKSRLESLLLRVPGLTGITSQNFSNNWGSGYKDNSFESLQAIFFNACTCILQGCNNSVHLKDPARSIPKGTLLAHFTTLTFYIVLFMLFALVGNRDALTNNTLILSAEIAWPYNWFVYVGIILSSTGAALIGLTSAPLSLNSIVEDDMLPNFFRFLKGGLRKSVFFTAGLICCSIFFGSLNKIAPLVSIFYLLCYGGVNFACFLLDWLGSPNWRPKWKYYHKATSFVGVIMCVSVMLVISWWASLAAIIAAAVIYAYIDRKS